MTRITGADLQLETIDLRPAGSLRIDPDRDTPRRSHELGPSGRIDFDNAVHVAEQIRPKLTSMDLANKHPLSADIEATRHDDCKSIVVGNIWSTVSREADAVRLVKVLILRTMCVRLPRQHHSWYETTAMVGWLVCPGSSITHRTERAVQVAIENDWRAAVDVEEDKRVGQRDKP